MTVTDTLKVAHNLLRKAVPGKRRRAHAEEGPLAQTFRVAMQIWDQQKAEGVPLAERIAGLEKTLRAAWPQGREWKYLCKTCDDYGLDYDTCDGERPVCGRHKPHLPHAFGRPCWCGAGSQFREKPKPSAEDFAAAGATKSKPTRVGR